MHLWTHTHAHKHRRNSTSARRAEIGQSLRTVLVYLRGDHKCLVSKHAGRHVRQLCMSFRLKRFYALHVSHDIWHVPTEAFKFRSVDAWAAVYRTPVVDCVPRAKLLRQHRLKWLFNVPRYISDWSDCLVFHVTSPIEVTVIICTVDQQNGLSKHCSFP